MLIAALAICMAAMVLFTIVDAVASSYADALLPIFGWMVPLFVVTAVVALLLPEVPLSRKSGMEQVAEAQDTATAVPVSA